MTTPTTPAPGWYHDGVTHGSLRWFDGVAWTDRLAPAQPYVPQPPDHGPTSAVHWMLPVGRSWQSVVAGYLGLFSLGIWVLGPVSIGFGVWALVRAKDGGHGRGRAITGVVGGLLGTAVLVAFMTNAGGA